MEIVKDPKVDWLSYKWWFIVVSAVLLLGGTVSLMVRGLNLGVDFTGGTLVYIKFKDTPELDRIRQVLGSTEIGAQEVTRFDDPSKNEVQVRMARIETDEADFLTRQSQNVLEALHAEFDREISQSGRLDFNNSSRGNLAQLLRDADPENLRESMSLTEFENHYSEIAKQIADVRSDRGGILRDQTEIESLPVADSVKTLLKEQSYLGSFTLLSVESVGPKVGQELQARARSAILFSLVGMLVYIAFRFRPIYGVAAIVALFHDVLITVGFFSMTNKEISLTVVAGLLTLVGYSINDTIVIFDRVRENLRLMRKNDLRSIINAAINQTLNRTILTSGSTFMAVFALYLLGGPALNSFSFALVVGIIVGTYSSVAIASPIVLWWQNYRDAQKKARA